MALSVSLSFSESLLQCRQVQKITAVWMPCVAGLLLAQATRRGRSGTAGLALSPRAPARPVPGSFFVFIRLLRSLTAPPQQPQQLRRARSCSPLQNRSLHLHRSAALFSSTSSTPWLHRLSFGKGALSVPDTAAMCVSSPELRPPWLGYLGTLTSSSSCLDSSVVV